MSFFPPFKITHFFNLKSFRRVPCDMFVPKDGSYGVLHPVTEMAYLEEPGHAGHKDTYKSQKDKRRPSPYDSVDGTVYTFDLFNKTFHDLLLKRKKVDRGPHCQHDQLFLMHIIYS